MNVVLWLIAGGAVGWVACSTLHVNASRGLVVSAIIGVVGAFFGGHVLAPIFHGATVNPGDFSPFALLMAAASAIACVVVSDMMYEHFGV
jgi:uncharacterized membrane protein YeaQ/YmgE (transglycosylase-associated protein family)